MTTIQRNPIPDLVAQIRNQSNQNGSEQIVAHRAALRKKASVYYSISLISFYFFHYSYMYNNFRCSEYRASETDIKGIEDCSIDAATIAGIVCLASAVYFLMRGVNTANSISNSQ